jgi:acyl carrier protein
LRLDGSLTITKENTMSVTTTTIEARIFKALEELDADPESISREAGFEELDIDSLDLAELSQIIDDEYGVKIKGSDMESLKTVGDVIDFVAAEAA